MHRIRDYLSNANGLWIPLVLIMFALWDLRIDLRILLDHITLIAIVFAIKSHPLAILVLIFSPSLIKKYYK